MAATHSLAVVAGNAVGRSVDVPSEGLVIGRSAADAGRLGGDDSLSRRHARLIVTGDGQLLIEDLGSTNGTYVNKVRIHAPRLLQPGDEIELGETRLAVRGAGPGNAASGHPSADDAGSPTDAWIGGNVRADRGSVGAVGAVHGNVDLSRHNVRADRGGYAIGRDLYQSHRHEYDASGLGLLTRTRGIARLCIAVGILLGISGLALGGYPLVREITKPSTFGSSPAKAARAQRACEDRFPAGSREQFRCIQDANNAQFAQDSEAFTPDFTPWLPLGVAVFFAGMLTYLVGIFLIRREPDD